MRCFAVIRERGPAWNWSMPMRRQAQWDAHAAFMDDLANRGIIVAGGPLGGEDDAPRVPHVGRLQQSTDESAIEAMLAEDPWTPMGLLTTVSIEPWTVLLGRFD